MRLMLMLPLLALSLVACNHANRSACPTQDLTDFGREEALRGSIATLPKPDCEIDAAEQQRYLTGREEGLKRYCLAERGYQLGLDGKAVDTKLCADDAAKELQRGFEIGDNLRSQLRQRDDLITQAQDVERVAADLPEGSPERRKLEDQAAGLRFDARQHDNEVEALRGIVAVEKWR